MVQQPVSSVLLYVSAMKPNLTLQVGYPLDTIKVTLQTNPHYKGSIDCFLGILRNKGVCYVLRPIANTANNYKQMKGKSNKYLFYINQFLKPGAFFRGMLSPTSGYCFSSAVCFSSYGAALRWQRKGQESPTTFFQAVMSGACKCQDRLMYPLNFVISCWIHFIIRFKSN